MENELEQNLTAPCKDADEAQAAYAQVAEALEAAGRASAGYALKRLRGYYAQLEAKAAAAPAPEK